MGDLEYILSRIPEDLDARFAGVDLKLAAIREVQALHTTRFSKLDALLAERFGAIDGHLTALHRKLDGLAERVNQLSQQRPRT